MFNAEKYLSVCLESILNQTLTDFELLVVDDCSTDSSYEIAESYLEKFGGRLKIISLPENTGSGAVPRNVGLDFATGKYVYFMDADDLITDNALETLYEFAEEFQADAVYFDRVFKCDDELIPEKLIEEFLNPTRFSSQEPTFETDDLAERVEKFTKFAFYFPPWTKFVWRDLLVDNEIKFPPIRISEDAIWTFKILCRAKKFLRIPTPLYVRRLNKLSMMGRKRTPQDALKFWLNPLLTGIDCLNEFMNEFELFNRSNKLRMHVLDFFAEISFYFMREAFKSLSCHEICKILFEDVSKSTGNHTALISYLIFIANIYRNELKNRAE